MDKIINQLISHVTNEFLSKMNNLFVQFQIIESKIKENAKTIDEVIHLIDYIEKI